MNDYIKSIYFMQYKSFSEDQFQELKDIKKINVIIGKNNTGKSSIIDIIHYILDLKEHGQNENRLGVLELGLKLTSRILASYKNQLPSNPKIIDDAILYDELRVRLRSTSGLMKPNREQEGIIKKIHFEYYDQIANSYVDKRNNNAFRRLNAERDIQSEQEDSSEALYADGQGASNLVRMFLLIDAYPEELIQEKLLKGLNKIMKPEASYKDIKIQRLGNDTQNAYYEIFLTEENLGRFALSQSGSGLKTIILILLNLLIIPETELYKNRKIVYAFEEIENNLHPALQRRLFDYLYKYADEHNTCIFLTTHSHVAINTFFGKDEAQIYHVIKENNVSSVKQIDNYVDKVEILNDLDVRASDLFQSNGIIWVEGPTDRIYIKRWLEVFCNNQYEEGKDYQFLYYGGRLLSHYDATGDEDMEKETEDLINILTTNRNSAIVMDSDKEYQADSINDTKKRIEKRFSDNGQFCWRTKGREIENYLSKKVLEDCFGITIRNECEQYGKYSDYIKHRKKDIGDTLINNKVPFARKVYPFITEENSKDILDLKDKIGKLYSEIKKWNGQG